MNLTNLNRDVDRHFPWLDTVFVACTATGDETLLGYPLTLQNESFNKCLNISKIKKTLLTLEHMMLARQVHPCLDLKRFSWNRLLILLLLLLPLFYFLFFPLI